MIRLGCTVDNLKLYSNQAHGWLSLLAPVTWVESFSVTRMFYKNSFLIPYPVTLKVSHKLSYVYIFASAVRLIYGCYHGDKSELWGCLALYSQMLWALNWVIGFGPSFYQARQTELSDVVLCVTPVKYDWLTALSETSLRLSETILNPQSVKQQWNESTRSTAADLKMIVSNTPQYVGPERSNALELKKTLLSLICLLSWVFSCYGLYFSTHPLFHAVKLNSDIIALAQSSSCLLSANQ